MKSVFLITPSFSRNGGIRVILEWANRLSDTYKVYLRILNNDALPTWFQLKREVSVVRTDAMLPGCQLVIITSPHSIPYARMSKAKKVIFLQMLEHLFRPRDLAWQELCRKTYQSPLPMICISQWNMEVLRDEFKRTAPTFYVGNGVNMTDFPIEKTDKDNVSILVEGWVAHNRSKDCDHAAPLAAERLKKEFGCRIITYSAHAPSGPYKHLPDEYYMAPSLAQMNEIYSRATIMLKASKYDARSCAPMEAMTKGTVTARAIIKGDDDLIHGFNCLRSDYNEFRLYEVARELFRNRPLRDKLAQNGFNHLRQNSWDIWMQKIKGVLESI